ncbi:Tripartite motif-containing protein 16 [Merluccius polli]|uniref:Tripartite motif-containing protein 16 n=1 Tax=Merluccius polli TaxID=89951 RepID=A0AA47PB97_MERPO|nr:Tripartite motif-containing protein 16 [Merluccius polli]
MTKSSTNVPFATSFSTRDLIYESIPSYQRWLAQIKPSVRVKEQPSVEPGEVPCDVCTGTQLKAVKSCLVCLTSYCHTHLEQHETVTRMKKHRLVEPMDRLEDRMCKKHERLLELFCQTDQVCVCQFCTDGDHRSHPVVPLKEEYEVKTAQLGKIESEVQQMIQKRKQKIQEIKDTVGRSKADADREIADGEKVLTALISCVEKQRDDFNQTVKEKLKSTEKQAEGLIKELEQEIEDLTNRSSEVKQLTHTEDHLHFLQTFTSLKNPPHTRDWTTVEVCPPSYVGTLRRALDQLEETLSMEMKKVPDLRSSLKKYACGLTLDPNTAHRHLSLSEDHRKVMGVGKDQSHPDHPDRFDSWVQVLCREGLTGRCYWEVERRGPVYIGVTYRGITRRGGGGDSRLGGNNKSWSLYCYDDSGYSVCYNGSRTDISLLPSDSTRVGVCVDRPAGSLSFYRVSPGRRALCSPSSPAAGVAGRPIGSESVSVQQHHALPGFPPEHEQAYTGRTPVWQSGYLRETLTSGMERSRTPNPKSSHSSARSHKTLYTYIQNSNTQAQHNIPSLHNHKIISAFRKNPNLKDILVRARFSTKTGSAPSPHQGHFQQLAHPVTSLHITGLEMKTCWSDRQRKAAEHR